MRDWQRTAERLGVLVASGVALSATFGRKSADVAPTATLAPATTAFSTLAPATTAPATTAPTTLAPTARGEHDARWITLGLRLPAAWRSFETAGGDAPLALPSSAPRDVAGTRRSRDEDEALDARRSRDEDEALDARRDRGRLNFGPSLGRGPHVSSEDTPGFNVLAFDEILELTWSPDERMRLGVGYELTFKGTTPTASPAPTRDSTGASRPDLLAHGAELSLRFDF